MTIEPPAGPKGAPTRSDRTRIVVAGIALLAAAILLALLRSIAP